MENIDLARTDVPSAPTNSLWEQILQHLHSHASALDPNWASVITFVEGGEIKAWVNGPLMGNQPLPVAAFGDMASYFADVRGSLFCNPLHEVIPMPGKLVVHFEGFEEGYVSSVSGSGNLVIQLAQGGEISYTTERLQRELKMDDRLGNEALFVFYCPFRYPRYSVHSGPEFLSGEEIAVAHRVFHDRDDGNPVDEVDRLKRIAEHVRRLEIALREHREAKS